MRCWAAAAQQRQPAALPRRARARPRRVSRARSSPSVRPAPVLLCDGLLHMAQERRTVQAYKSMVGYLQKRTPSTQPARPVSITCIKASRYNLLHVLQGFA